ncbi:multiprotein bridging factor aMBF1 [Candidatus Nanosalina sp. VS9-1]|uniref:multiprotein bridging factor aMBF1 n=1 Tax=Candidatus Nanosalina sp. VS9-1 TaxID=3388566 RepID=UPI0039DFEEC3
MSSCELCGREQDSLKKAKIEGATLNVCDSCAEMGETVETTSKKRKKKKSRSTSSSSRKTKVLDSNYGEKIKQAREKEKLSISEVADSLNEKESVIKKIESQDLKPEKSLASKIGKKFGIDLYVNPEVSDVDQDSGDDRSATLGDVADVKE